MAEDLIKTLQSAHRMQKSLLLIDHWLQATAVAGKLKIIIECDGWNDYLS